MRRLSVGIWCAALMSCAGGARAQAPLGSGEGGEVAGRAKVQDRQGAGAATTAHLVRMMQETLDMRDFQAPMTLKEAISLFYDKFQERGKELAILIDQQSFKAADPQAPDLYETQVKFPPYPKQMPMITALKIALSQVPTVETTFLVRHGRVDLIAARAATLEKLALQTVIGDYLRRPIRSVISDIGDQTGLSIVVDNRIDDKLNVPLTVTFGNGITAADALQIICDMGSLKLVEMPTSYYVTTRTNTAADYWLKAAK